ncbi:flavohemoglobin expression-modulating QEGLA motif protein [Lysobacter sp. TAF61]|uniref:flavohemoglobin expression-modulating QEGLA motif protein n=1 Tax=Lysobacter sp. TAF61 TaxID=3233072 RepID=UPI003F98B2EB
MSAALPIAPPAPDALKDPALVPLFEQDRTLVKLGRDIRVLKAIDWPMELEQQFLAGWKVGRPELPLPPTQPHPMDAQIEGLDGLLSRIDRGHPLGMWLYKSAWSYRVAAQMLGAIGTPEYTRCSALLYGRPDYLYPSQDSTNADMARELLRVTDELINDRLLPDVPVDIDAPEFARRLRERIDPFFNHDKVEVVLDPNLASKATAGSKRVTLRATAMFSERDLEQLIQHEAFIHTLTALNGKHQPYLTSLGCGAPRTTRAQEGLATFSEIITGAIDIARLRRVALRVVMVEQALKGADFIEVFRGFLDAGQSEVESYRSTARIFRGGNVRGLVCFTKDGAYLEGVLRIYAFICKALQEGRGELLPLLFCGRVTVADTVVLEPYRNNGLIVPPRYVPPWARDPQRVLSVMAFSSVVQRLRLDDLTVQRFVDVEAETVEASGIGV